MVTIGYLMGGNTESTKAPNPGQLPTIQQAVRRAANEASANGRAEVMARLRLDWIEIQRATPSTMAPPASH